MTLQRRMRRTGVVFARAKPTVVRVLSNLANLNAATAAPAADESRSCNTA